MKVRECFLQAVAIVDSDEDAREAWADMNRINAPWAAVFESKRLIGIVNKMDLDAFIRVPEVFQKVGEVAKTDMPSRRGISLSPDADLRRVCSSARNSESGRRFCRGRWQAAWCDGDGCGPSRIILFFMIRFCFP